MEKSTRMLNYGKSPLSIQAGQELERSQSFLRQICSVII